MIGSLHTMSYLEPHSAFGRFIARFKRTQKVNILEQYEKYNVRAFDLHLYFVGNKGRAIFKYGGIEYQTFSVYEILNYLNSKENVYVRIVLEDNGEIIAEENRQLLEKRFAEYCKIIDSIYPNMKFFGGYREYDFKQIYQFKDDAPDNLIFYKRVDKLNKQ